MAREAMNEQVDASKQVNVLVVQVKQLKEYVYCYCTINGAWITPNLTFC